MVAAGDGKNAATIEAVLKERMTAKKAEVVKEKRTAKAAAAVDGRDGAIVI